MSGSNTVIACPHCFGKIELAATAPYRFPYNLSIICMTRGGGDTKDFVLGLDAAAKSLGAEFLVGAEEQALSYGAQLEGRTFSMASEGYVESTLNRLALHARGQWVLRLDDDESISPAMFKWLKEKSYEGHPAWAFPTAALWGDDEHFITTPPFWPDTHVRLTTWDKSADWPNEPHGKPDWVRTAKTAPVAIRHHKFLVKSYQERRRIADAYEAKLKGGGHGRRQVYNTPEDVLTKLTVSLVGDGPVLGAPPLTGEVIDLQK